MPKKNKTPTPPRPSILMPARAQEDEEFRRVAVSLEGKTLAVESIDQMVEEAELWEPGPVFKIHYYVTLQDGRVLGIFENTKTVSWYKADTNSSGTG